MKKKLLTEEQKRTAIRQIIKEEYPKAVKLVNEILKEQNLETVKLPSTIQTAMTKLAQYIEKANLNRAQKMSAVKQLVDALGLDGAEFSRYVTTIKRQID